MTTLAALSTKDALVMGCDSLGSVSKNFIDTSQLAIRFFDHKNGWVLKLDKEGHPLLKNIDDVLEIAQMIPFNHMTHVDKLFSLAPLEMGIMITGISSIGDRTIKSLVGEFIKEEPAFQTEPKRPPNYTVNSIAKKFLRFINRYYKKEFKDRTPYLEFIIGGYDKQKTVPAVIRIYVHDNEIADTMKGFGIVFGGQMQEIQRLVFGTDPHNEVLLQFRVAHLYHHYRDKLQEYLSKNGVKLKLPPPEDYKDELMIFEDQWELDGFDANWGDFSEQNAINCVDFFINIMIKSQQFSSSMPTVGGDVHMAIIHKDRGFQFISREEWEHSGYTTPKGVGNDGI